MNKETKLTDSVLFFGSATPKTESVLNSFRRRYSDDLLQCGCSESAQVLDLSESDEIICKTCGNRWPFTAANRDAWVAKIEAKTKAVHELSKITLRHKPKFFYAQEDAAA